MTPLSETILADWQVRKTKNQKTSFIEFMKSQIPDLQVEQGGFGNNRNLVVGDVKTAEVILTAHYDTCAQLPFPNFLPPKNLLLYIGYSLLICIPFGIVALILNNLLQLVTNDFLLLYWGTFLPTMALMFYLFMGGKPNPHTANDNTSGVITLCEVMAGMTEEQRSRTAFVFFDNEENGLLGSAFFRKLHKKDGIDRKLLINYDCVSDGDYFLFVLNKKAYDKAHFFAAAFLATDENRVCFERSSNTIYPSDQSNFPMGVGVAAMKYKPVVGLYMDRIHTIRDTVFQQENITFLVNGTLSLMDLL